MSALSTTVSLAMLATLGLAQAPAAQALPSAAAPDAASTAVASLFGRLATDFLPQVASGTALARQLPTLAVTPAESVDLRTAFSQALAPGGQLQDLGTQPTLAALTTYVAGADGKGWDFSAIQPDSRSVTVGFTRLEKKEAGLDVRDQAGTLSLSSGSGIDVTGTLTGYFTFVYDATTGSASLTKPALGITTTADLPAGEELDAGLGILGVTVTGVDGTADYGLTSSVTTTWANPDNDAAGALAFDNPGTPAANDGELAAAGAGTGIVTAVRTGSLSGQLVAKPRPNGSVAGLPSVGATVTLSTAAPATFDAPSVTAVVPDAAKPFLTMTPRDLAAGLSQAASAIIGMQDARDGNLPLMRGSIGNAVDAVGGIKEFLADQVPDADPSDQTPGQPKFASLQDMLVALNGAQYADSGWSIDVAGGGEAPTFVPATKTVNFTVHAARRGASDVELNILGAPTTGTGTYSPTGLTATGVDFDGPDGTSGAQLVGRKVTAGTSYATVASVTGPSALTITADGWSAGEPTDGTVFSIEAADPKTGAPELADTLAATTGIGAANADVSTATATPTVDVTLPLALDLSAPLTYTNSSGATVPDCDPSSGTAPCPFQQVDASGLGRVITSLPLASDRVLLRQSARNVLVADVAITSPVQISTSSGFLGLSISGDVKVAVPSGKHLQVLALTGTGDIPLPAFVEKVRAQAAKDAGAPEVFSQTLGGTVTARLAVQVDDAPDAFADGVDSTSLTVTGDVDKLADGIGAGEVNVTATEPGRAALLKALNFEPDNPTSLFGGVQAAFEGAGSDLTTMTGGGLETPIPFVGSSISQLVGAGASGAGGVTYAQHAGIPAAGDTPALPATTWLTDPGTHFDAAFIGRQVVIGSTSATIVDASGTTLVVAPQLTLEPADDTPYLVENELLGAVHVLTAATPATLQEALSTAQTSLGNDSTIDFGLVADSAGAAQLRLDLTWQREYAVSRPVSLTFGSGGGQQLVGVDAGGELSVEASGTVKLRLLLPLSKAAMLAPLANTRIDTSETSLDFGVAVAAEDAHLGANIGPVSVKLGALADPDHGIADDDLGSLRAGFGVEASSAASGTNPSLADFFSSGFDVGVTNGGACTTDGPTPTGTKDVLCADFPVYISNAKASGGNFTVTSTLGSGDDLADVFTGASTKVSPPTSLANVLAGTPFKFDTLSEGLQQYLFYAESSLRTASNNGEMPVIGKDLQAGADFMGKTRTKIDTFIEANGDPSTVGVARTMLTTKLASALGIVVDGSNGIQLDFTCKSTGTGPTTPLNPPSAAPVVKATGAVAADTAEYRYRVVATYNGTGTVQDSVPSAVTPAATLPGVKNAATLTATKFNTVTWKSVRGATGYKVLREQRASSTAAWGPLQVVGLVKSFSASFRDKGVAVVPTPPSPYVPKTTAPQIPAGTVCTDDQSVTDVEGVTLGLEMGQGVVSADKGCEDDLGGAGTDDDNTCVGGKLPVDLGLPGLSLQTGDSGSVSGKVGWALDVKVGMSRSRGFYIDTEDQDEFEVGAALKLDKATAGPDLKAQLAIINVDVTKNADKPEFVGHFGIDITDPDGALTLAEIARTSIAKSIKVSVDAKVDIDWHLKATADAALPGVATDFRLTWGWGAASGQPAGTPATNTSGLVVKFDNVTLNAGEFFGKALKPYLDQVVDATKPLQPIIDTIFTPMPVISDLSKAAGGEAVTIATLADKFNTLPGGAKIKPFLNAIDTVRKLSKKVSCTSTDCGVNIGSFNLTAARVATTNASPGNAKTLIENPQPKTGAGAALVAKDSSGELGRSMKDKVGKALPGISIPVLKDPTLLFGLISGGDIPLVEFDSGPLSLGFQFQKSFGPIYAPPPVMMVIGGGASVTLRIAAGFDTYGIRRAMETGDGAQVLDSLYFKTVDDDGSPIPVVQFTGYLEAGASVSLGILEVGVVGGIKLTVGFYWNDPNNDGKFRLFEFAGAVATNPICLFNVGGELSLYIKIFVEIGFSPFSVSFDFTLVNIKLLDFNLKPNCTPPPPRLGGTSGKVLYVFAGNFGGAGPRGDKAWAADATKSETWVVRQVPAYKDADGVDQPAAVEIRGLGLTESFPDTAANPIDTVVLDGRGWGGALTVTFTGGSGPVDGSKPVPFSKKAVVFTGSGDDVIRTGEGESWVDAGAGADSVTTLDRTELGTAADSVEAHVAGGPGADVITVGNGKDTVSGDGSLGTSANISPTVTRSAPNTSTVVLAGMVDPAAGKLSDPAGLWSSTVGTGDGADQIAAGLGQSRLSGNGGADTIGTANDSTLADSAGIKAGTTGGSAAEEALYRARPSVLVGGAGSDVLKSGSADDEVYTGSHDVVGESATGAGDGANDVNTVDTGTGSDTVYGANGADFVTTSSSASQKTVVYGAGGADVLTGGLGSDEIYGGPGDDYVVAAPATVGEPGSATDALGSARDVGVLPGAGSSPKKLVGGTGSDRIYGADGASTIFGDTTVDACAVQTSPVSKQPAETANALDAADLVLGGNGVDVVNAGGGADWVYASGAADRVCGNAGDDHLYGGDADDLVQGGSGADQGYGEAGADQVYGNDGADALYGGAGTDRLQGNNGADWLDGGSEADVVLGGTSEAGRADGADVLLGSSGSDVLVGDDAQTDLATGAPYPTDLASSDATLGAGDYLVGGDDADRTFGGLGNDTVYGGTGDDYTEGNPGTDRLYGESGDDDLVGGSSELASGLFSGSEPGRPDGTDYVYGGSGQDVVAGDNARITRGGTAHPATTGRGLVTPRTVDLADESSGTPTGISGGDLIQGGDDTDVVFAQRGPDDVSLGDGADYGEGGPGADSVHGDAGDDDVVGGSSTAIGGTAPSLSGQPDADDRLYGDAGEDVVLGDNGAVVRPAASNLVTSLLFSPLTVNRVVAQRTITTYDLGDGSTLDPTGAATSGADTITGSGGNDVLLAQGGDDSVDGGSEADYAEGGQGSDLVQGGSEDDDLAGGSSATTASSTAGAVGQPDGADDVYGGSGSDLALGDNGLLTRVTVGRDPRTNRADATQTALVPGRGIALYDLVGTATSTTAGTVGHFGADAISGQTGSDVLVGQDGTDAISGGSNDDYAEGGGAADALHGDVALTTAEIVLAPAGSAWTTPVKDDATLAEGQDDLVGGWNLAGYRDGADVIRGDGGADFVLADNGSVTRVVDAGKDRVYTPRYGTLPVGAAKVRVAGGTDKSTRFCPVVGTGAAATCDLAGASGADKVYGDGGQDVLYGQDGDDEVYGGADDDDLYGELGADRLFGEDGEDAILGDRGGVQDRYETGARSTTTSLKMPPALTYTSRRSGSVSREADLLHDVNGTDFVGSATATAMPLDGITYGGADRIRGGAGRDSIHGGAGDDLANGDAGGDAVFGGRGADVLWGGVGQVCTMADTACQAEPGANGEFIDALFGGKDGDVIDWRPRGVYGTAPDYAGRTCTTGPAPVTTQKDGTTDPCSWFEMTDRANDVASSTASFADNQHHQGVDWAYGGWDRDVLQADLSENGPHPGDRLMDWSGVYNLYSHCNAAYGGFTDVRNSSPQVEDFFRQWATGNGAGRPAGTGTTADTATPGTSGYDELALVYNSDNKDHATGGPYPSSPGHFDAEACSGF
ncbi:hypothetical protein H5V45_00190 [Nocardioides sp. KIGAM211]|uniref:Ca2+-binding protein, RTX toxin-related n=1 Tax=Nocardioides luti TaxID=2761101 RepID=A0A7X0V8L1_9ACTN|nr:hypothetical protein [Nocardioides luti]MBB6625724.1 hypothetical protein [Nocardioides luti]